MAETWLKPNRRALWLAAALASGVLIGGLVLLLPGWSESPGWSVWVGGGLIVLGGWGLAAVAWQMRQPRVGYRDGEVLLHLNSGAPYAVPLEAVEAFLLGQAPANLPGERGAKAETVTVVVRLAEKAANWQRREVKPALASWCDGYITIRGTWCEPLDEETVRRLNRQLAAAKREART